MIGEPCVMLDLCYLACLLRPSGWLVFDINDWPFALPGLSLCCALHRLRPEQPYGGGRDGLFVIARRDGLELAR